MQWRKPYRTAIPFCSLQCGCGAFKVRFCQVCCARPPPYDTKRDKGGNTTVFIQTDFVLLPLNRNAQLGPPSQLSFEKNYNRSCSCALNRGGRWVLHQPACAPPSHHVAYAGTCAHAKVACFRSSFEHPAWPPLVCIRDSDPWRAAYTITCRSSCPPPAPRTLTNRLRYIAPPFFLASSPAREQNVIGTAFEV